LQVRARIPQRRLARPEDLGRGRVFCAAQGGLQPVRAGRDFAVERFGGRLRPRAALACLPRGIEGALACVDGVVQRLTVITLIDGGMRFLQSGGGGGELGRRVQLGSGGAGGVDGGLRLVDLFLRGTRTACDGEQQESGDQQATHDGKV